MAYNDIVVDFKWMLIYSAIYNLRMTCYDIVVDYEWMVDLLGNL